MYSMSNQKVKIVGSVVALVIVIVAIGYYVWMQSVQTGDGPSSDFKVMTNLSEEQVNEYRLEYNELMDTLAQAPDDFDSLMRLGMIKKYVGDYRGAEEVWVQVGERQPKNSTSFGNLADLYANYLKEYSKAEIAYQVAIKNSTGEPLNMLYYRNYYDFARLYLKDNEKAEQIVLQAVEDNLESQDMYVLAGQFYRDSGNKTKALTYFQKALTFDPTDELVKQEIQKLK